MKLNLIQMTAFCFMLGWVGMDVVGADYNERLFWSCALAFGHAYLNNMHGIYWGLIARKINNKTS